MFLVDLLSNSFLKLIDFLFSKKGGGSKRTNIKVKDNKGSIQQNITYNFYVNKYYPSIKEIPPSPIKDTEDTGTLEPTEEEIEEAVDLYIQNEIDLRRGK